MRVSSYNPQSRYRRKSANQLAAFITVLVILMLAFGFGFWMGKQAAGHGERSLKKQVAEIRKERDALQDTVTEARAEAQTAVMRYDQLQEEYNKTVPEGPMRDLVTMLGKQIEEGRDPKRLAFLIRSARPPRNCTEPETKRFVLSTPSYTGPGGKITLADGALVVRGSGASAVNSAGKPEAWFDPSKKVSIDFVALGGVKETKSGVLPIHHSVVVGAKEYRLTISEGAKSFAKVSFDSCDYP